MTSLSPLGWSISDHLDARARGISAVEVITALLDELDRAVADDRALFIGPPLRRLALAAARDVDQRPYESLPLHGVPFVVKDNIDVLGVQTSCGCPEFAYTPSADAAVVARLRAAGAIPVGKTNLDQFATGLVGVRSPHGTPKNPIAEGMVPGGSSSGSGVAVALGLVPLSLGTDTAGSGRVPAAMCGIVGLKPTVGRLPSRGMFPAVRRIDCPTVFARSVRDARLAAQIMSGHEPGDPYSLRDAQVRRVVRRVGVLTDAALSSCDVLVQQAYRGAAERLTDLGVEIITIDIEPFLVAGRLLYGGAFVGERTAAVGDFLVVNATTAQLDPTVEKIIGGGLALSAVDAYRSEYRLAEAAMQAAPTWERVDAVLFPTIPKPVSINEVQREPIQANSMIGTFTTCTNLLNLCALTVPIPATNKAPRPGEHIQLMAPAWCDEAIADLAQQMLDEPMAATGLRPGELSLAVVGAHLSGMPLHHQLTARGARLLATTTTAASYQLFALSNTVPPKPGSDRVVNGGIGVEPEGERPMRPGLRRVESGGAAIQVEVYALGATEFASFVNEVPAPLGIGNVELMDGTWVKGFICEPYALSDATDITSFGGWRSFIGSTAGSAS
jgi:allophanate hydrolase